MTTFPLLQPPPPPHTHTHFDISDYIHTTYLFIENETKVNCFGYVHTDQLLWTQMNDNSDPLLTGDPEKSTLAISVLIQ